MSIHEALRTLVSRYDERVLDSADELRATLDDFLEERQANPGDIALLVDAVRLGTYHHMLAMLRHGADPEPAVEAAGARMAQERGGDQRSACWALAALGYAVGQVPERVVRSYRDEQPPRAGMQDGGFARPMHPTPPSQTSPTQPAGDLRLPHTQPLGASPLAGAQYANPSQQPARPSQARVAMAVAAVLVLVAVVAGGTWYVARTVGPETSEVSDSAAADDTDGEPTPPETPASSTPTTEPTSEPTEPTSEPTTEPPAEPATKPTAAGPLGVVAPFVNQACEGQIIVVLASSADPAEYESTIAPVTGAVPGAKYLRTDQSCDAFVQEIDGQPIYAAYVGPFPSLEDACQERYASGIVGAYVRTLESGRTTPDLCSCLDGLSELPRLSIDNASDGSYDVKLRVVDLQTMLRNADYNPEGYVTGYFKEATRAMVRDFQRAYGLAVDGRVGPQTWDALRRVGCS